MTDPVILSLKNISKYYPGVKAVDNVSLSFVKGEVHALVGENGAGKSTLIKCIAGAIVPDEGTIAIAGNTYSALDPRLAQMNGIEVIYQEFNLVPALSVTENIFLCKKTSPGFIVNDKERREKAVEILKQMKFEIDPARPVSELSPAYQQVVEIAKAISSEVKILIMDEPTAPLTVSEVKTLFDIIRDLKSKGITIIYISHRLEELFEVADRVSVMRDGKYIATKNIGDTSRSDLISMMAGRTLSETFPTRKPPTPEEVLRVENLSGNGLQHINFCLNKGEVLGFAGLVGAGRTELMQMIYGVVPPSGGRIFLHQKHVAINTPGDAIAHSIGLIPEDRKRQGVFLNNSIKWNMVINAIRRISPHGVVDGVQEKSIAEEYQKKFNIKTPTLDQRTANLSGGNQQKVAIAKTMAAESEVLIFDEPTRGIDVGAKQEIYKLINELAEAGHSIIMVSSEMEELLGMSDRIIVIAEGRQTGELNRAEFDQHRILDLASVENKK